METGTKVRLSSTGEVGIILHSWNDSETGDEDNHIAFFGEDFPIGQPERSPYVLRYFTSSLEKIDVSD
ncbi:MAG: hypothetical protein AAGB26_00085 [Planctomycetota bacterium]